MTAAVSIYLTQKRVTQWIKALPGLAALVGTRIFNRVPKDTPYPYLTFQFQSVEEAPGKGAVASLFVTCRFDFFSDYYGDDTLLQVFDELMTQLNGRQDIEVAPGVTIDVFQFITAAFARSEDGAQHIASYTYTFYVSPPPNISRKSV